MYIKNIYKYRNIFACLIVFVLLGSMFMSAAPAVAEELSVEEMQPIGDTGNEQVMPLSMVLTNTWCTTTAASTLMYAPYPSISAATAYTVPLGASVCLLGRTYDCFYVHYEVPNGKVIRGYIPISVLNPTSYIWIDYDVFRPATCTATTQVISGPGTTNTYYATGEIYANENPLMVLGTEVNPYNNVTYYYVQYQTSSGLVKRGWIDPRGGTVTVNNLSWSNLSTSNEYIIMNVSSGKVLHWNTDNTVVQKTLSDRDRQLFKLEQTSITGYYKIVASRNTNMALSVNTNSFTEGLPMVMQTKGTTTKGQEFYIEANGYDSATYKPKYGILTRVTGNFRGVEVYGSSGAEGASVIQSLYYGNANQQWLFIPYIEKQARILYDSTNTYSVADLTAIYKEATEYLFDEFNVDFSVSSVQLASNLSIAGCSTANAVPCVYGCGDYVYCETLHHKNADNILDANPSVTHYTTTYVGHALCCYGLDEETDEEEHYTIFGLATVAGNKALVTSNTTNISRSKMVEVTLHELCHNLNASHSKYNLPKCLSDERCIFNGQIGSWCTVCYDRINSYLYGV